MYEIIAFNKRVYPDLLRNLKLPVVLSPLYLPVLNLLFCLLTPVSPFLAFAICIVILLNVLPVANKESESDTVNLEIAQEDDRKNTEVLEGKSLSIREFIDSKLLEKKDFIIPKSTNRSLENGTPSLSIGLQGKETVVLNGKQEIQEVSASPGHVELDESTEEPVTLDDSKRDDQLFEREGVITTVDTDMEALGQQLDVLMSEEEQSGNATRTDDEKDTEEKEETPASDQLKQQPITKKTHVDDEIGSEEDDETEDDLLGGMPEDLDD